MKNLVKVFVALFLLIGVSSTAFAFDPFQDYTWEVGMPLLQEGSSVNYTVPSTEATGKILETSFDPSASGNWNIKIWNLTSWDCSSNPSNPSSGALVEYAWKDYNNGNTWNVWKEELITCPTYVNTNLYAGSSSIAWRIRMASLDSITTSILRVLVTED